VALAINKIVNRHGVSAILTTYYIATIAIRLPPLFIGRSNQGDKRER
jgi:hypothetical protein